jgi:hypothetical protein
MSVAALPDDEFEIVPVPMDRETRRLLAAFARASNTPAVDVAASLLRDLLSDYEFWEAAAVEVPIGKLN